MENQGKKLAVLVGCLYKQHEGLHLKGCINDVMGMKKVLVKRFKFDSTNIEVLTDEHGSEVMPTGANIRKALKEMVEKAQNGDILFFHFSGHGTLIRHGGEAIVASDLNLIMDVDFRDLVNRLPKGATLTILSDSCHSGGLISQEKEQIGPSTSIKTKPETLHRKSKFIPVESLLQHLSTQTRINSSDIGTHLLALFGSEASLMFYLPYGQDADVDKQYRPDDGILLSGCQKNESSGDLSPGQGVPVDKPCGAFSNAVQTVLEKHEGPITNKELVKSARMVLLEQKLDDQHPCLYCSDSNASATFLMQEPKI